MQLLELQSLLHCQPIRCRSTMPGTSRTLPKNSTCGITTVFCTTEKNCKPNAVNPVQRDSSRNRHVRRHDHYTHHLRSHIDQELTSKTAGLLPHAASLVTRQPWCWTPRNNVEQYRLYRALAASQLHRPSPQHGSGLAGYCPPAPTSRGSAMAGGVVVVEYYKRINIVRGLTLSIFCSLIFVC